jgi:short subunit dehydrogenase-like uncharacterized protein
LRRYQLRDDFRAKISARPHNERQKPVVIYGANGFSGRLIAEFLREYNVPFIAAGRSRATA